MSQKNAKLLRKSAKKFNVPLNSVKRAFKNASPEARESFLVRARRMINEI